MKKIVVLLMASAFLAACGQKEESTSVKKDNKTEGHGIYKVPPPTKRPAHEGF